jgi:hypothetical protein
MCPVFAKNAQCQPVILREVAGSTGWKRFARGGSCDFAQDDEADASATCRHCFVS